MKPFLNADFLLPDESSQRLFHQYAANLPIIDFHCHLPPADVANDSRFKTIAHAWLGGDHYKWRAMRANGVPEADITGHEPDYRTFLAWARTVPSLVGNPLYHWTHLELQRYFGIHEPLSEKTAPMIWEACNAQIGQPEFGARALLTRMKVRAVCTTDDPADRLEHHIAYAAARKPGDLVMVPSYRPDKALAVEDPAVWNAYLAKLGETADLSIGSYKDLVSALDRRHAAFHELGCRATDHALITPVAVFASEEVGEPEILDIHAKLAVAVDPLDGSSNIETLAPMGTIFSILHAAPVVAESFLQTGRHQLAAGFLIYGPHTALVLTMGDGVRIFTLDPDQGFFVLTRDNITIPEKTREYAINGSNLRHWEPQIRFYVGELMLGKTGPRGEDFNTRWLASVVADAYRILVRGGVYLYPGDSRRDYKHGRLRLIYEANPVAMIIEQAGGSATDGHTPILDLAPNAIHQRVPLVFGSADEVKRVTDAYESKVVTELPLFRSRSLFRKGTESLG